MPNSIISAPKLSVKNINLENNKLFSFLLKKRAVYDKIKLQLFFDLEACLYVKALKPGGCMEELKKIWLKFEKTHPKTSQWVREGGLFLIVSTLITVFKYLLLTFLPLAFAFMGNSDFGFPGIDIIELGIFLCYTVSEVSLSKRRNGYGFTHN